MSENQESLVSQFKDITGSSEENAKFYLESANWSLEDAISSFFESDNAVNVPSDNDSPNEPTASVPENSKALPKSSSDGEGFVKKGNGGNGGGAKPKFATLTTINKDSSDEEEGQAFYAGGSERSGQQVLGSPKRKNNMRERLTDLFKMAQAELSERPASSSSGRSWGMGLRLGQPGDPEETRPTVNASSSSDSDIQTVILKLWRQGFSINDGELRPYDQPQNKVFLETVMRGEIPEEMQRMGSQLGVDVEDHRHEEYKKPARNVKKFDGSGHTLGSPVPDVEMAAPKEVPVDNGSQETNEARANEVLNLNTSAPVTNVQIRLADGSRLARQFNTSHTVNDIRQYIVNARPQYNNQNFILVTSFPTKELAEGSETIEQAKLQNAVIMQRLK
ncbi:NSFL1C family protein [Megaselia abdita]